jgi:predicted ATPase
MIQRFYVHNFRCLENFELPIRGRASALLIGKNGAGKSTVRLALEVLQKIGRGSNRVGDLLKPEDFARGRSDVPIRVEIEVKLADTVFGYHLALELPPGFRELRVAEERLAVNGEDLYSRDRAQVILTKTLSEGEARFRLDWHLVALPIIQSPPKSEALENFKQWLARMLILAPIPSLISGDSSGDSLMPNREVTNFGEWITGLLAHSPAAYEKIDRHLKTVMPDLKDIKNPVIGKNARSLMVQFQKEQATLTVSFRELSDGEKCFFIGAVVLASNEAYGPLFCFWDGPDNSLSLSEVGHFAMELRRSFQSGGQFLATSHNPEVMSQFSRENTFLLTRRSHLEPTLVKSLNGMPLKGDVADAILLDEIEV